MWMSLSEACSEYNVSVYHVNLGTREDQTGSDIVCSCVFIIGLYNLTFRPGLVVVTCVVSSVTCPLSAVHHHTQQIQTETSRDHTKNKVDIVYCKDIIRNVIYGDCFLFIH